MIKFLFLHKEQGQGLKHRASAMRSQMKYTQKGEKLAED